MESKPSLPALTGIRGFAAWYVVLYHIRGSAASQVPPELTTFLAKGYLAVDFFFMLSGFVLWLNYSDRLRRERLAAVPRFLCRRVARIWPLHLFILAGAVAFATSLVLAGRPNVQEYPWSELPLHILLIQNWGFTTELSWNDPAWSISCEFAAYLVFPLLVLAADWRKLPPVLLICMLVILAALLDSIMTLAGTRSLGADIPRLGIARALVEFSMGTIVCALWSRWRESGLLPVAASVAAATFLLLLWLSDVLAERAAVPLALSATLLAVGLTADKAGNPLGWRPVHYLGEISYATYLVHYLLFVAFKLAFVDDPDRIPLPLLGLFLLLTLAASAWLYHHVERPAQRLMNRAFDRHALRLRPASAGHGT